MQLNKITHTPAMEKTHSILAKKMELKSKGEMRMSEQSPLTVFWQEYEGFLKRSQESAAEMK